MLALQHSLAFGSRPVQIEAYPNGEMENADLAAMATSIPSDAQFTSRPQPGDKNTIDSLIRDLVGAAPIKR